MKLRAGRRHESLGKLELEIRQIVKEMKKVISDKLFQKAVFLREREIELKEEIDSAQGAYLDPGRRSPGSSGDAYAERGRLLQL